MTINVTTDQIKAACGWDGNWVIKPEDFDRWLAAHDADVRKAALLEMTTKLEAWAETWATQDGIEALMFAADDVAAVGIVEKLILAQAAAIRAAAFGDAPTTGQAATEATPERCDRRIAGSVPSWAGEDQIDPCRCVLQHGHDGICKCSHQVDPTSDAPTGGE